MPENPTPEDAADLLAPLDFDTPCDIGRDAITGPDSKLPEILKSKPCPRRADYSFKVHACNTELGYHGHAFCEPHLRQIQAVYSLMLALNAGRTPCGQEATIDQVVFDVLPLKAVS